MGTAKDILDSFQPELIDLRDRLEISIKYEEVSRELSYGMSDLRRALDSPTERFMNEYVVP